MSRYPSGPFAPEKLYRLADIPEALDNRVSLRQVKRYNHEGSLRNVPRVRLTTPSRRVPIMFRGKDLNKWIAESVVVSGDSDARR